MTVVTLFLPYLEGIRSPYFTKCISLKVNLIARLDFELAYLADSVKKIVIIAKKKKKDDIKMIAMIINDYH